MWQACAQIHLHDPETNPLPQIQILGAASECFSRPLLVRPTEVVSTGCTCRCQRSGKFSWQSSAASRACQ